MERSSKRGKIPQQDWPSIIKRYESGETLSSIARTYDCSPPAISYILTRSRTRDLSAGNLEAPAIVASGPSTSKADAISGPAQGAVEPMTSIVTVGTPNSIEAPAGEADPIGAAPASTGSAAPPDESAEVHLTDDLQQAPVLGAPAPHHAATVVAVEPQPAGARRTLHLSILNHTDQRAETPRSNGSDAEIAGRRDAGGPTKDSEAQRLRLVQESPVSYRPNGDASGPVVEPERRRDAANNFIDRALRERVSGDISAFLAAFDAALADDTVENRACLRQATDRLLRAGARTRIELERLEARVPLPARDADGYFAPNWRQR